MSDDYGPAGNAFTGVISWLQIDLGADASDADHYLSPEDRLRIALAQQ